MHITRLSLTDFRNYREADVSLSPGVSAFVGANGQGKTNLVEAVAYLGTLRSHRVSSQQPLIREGTESAVIRALVQRGVRSVLLEVQINRAGPNRARVNRSPVKPSLVSESVTTVVFAPEDLSLVRGDPAGRRDFIDGYLVQRTPRLSAVLSDYDRVLRQRNSLLKSARASGLASSSGKVLTTLDVWDEKLIELGSRIIEARWSALAVLGGPVRDAYHRIGGGDENPGIELQSTVLEETVQPEQTLQPVSRTEIAARFEFLIHQSRARELERGMTLTGPHRDDVLLTLNGMPARSHSSHGESWSFALALRLGSAAELRQSGGADADPIVILDDVFAELDRGRARALAEMLADFEQVLVTTAVADDLPGELHAQPFWVAEGVVGEGFRTGEPDE